MDEYLKNYQILHELQKNNQKKMEDNNILIMETHQKWTDETVKESNIDSEIKLLNQNYDELIKEKENEMCYELSLNIIIIYITSIILLTVSKPIMFVLTPLIVAIPFGILKLTSIIIEKFRPILKNKYKKDKDILNILEQIKTKENELSETKKTLDDYSREIIEYRSESKQLQEKQNYIEESINELMRNYAQPIFEEQLKNNQETVKEENLEEKKEQPKRKTRNQIVREKHKLI